MDTQPIDELFQKYAQEAREALLKALSGSERNQSLVNPIARHYAEAAGEAIYKLLEGRVRAEAKACARKIVLETFDRFFEEKP